MNQLALFVEPKPRVRSKPEGESITFEDIDLVQRAFRFEMSLYDRAIRKGEENRKLPTLTVCPIREGNRIVGSQTIYFSNHPDIDKRNTIVRKRR